MLRTLVALSVLLFATPVLALDKQGSAHGGGVAGSDEGFDVSGAASMGLSLYNPTYGARPDNSGRTLLRYALHVDVDLIGRRLSIPLDVNMFTDRLERGARKLAPTELDVISGVTSTFELGPGALELGTRIELDRQIGPNVDESDGTCNHGGLCSQSYVDVRARYLYSLATAIPSVASALQHGDVSGWFTLGWFAYNPSYAARPDNSGLALLRYGAHVELSVFDDVFSIGFDATMFTDRKTNAVKPTELDYTPELIFHHDGYEVHLAYEQDVPLDHDSEASLEIPIDKRGVRQRFVYVLGVWNFDLVKPAVRPLEDRGHIVSP
ncbi:MAG: hypothetical protein ACXVEE_16500 [Polyangiales bacterium]